MSIATNKIERAVSTNHRNTMPATMRAPAGRIISPLAYLAPDGSGNPASRAEKGEHASAT